MKREEGKEKKLIVSIDRHKLSTPSVFIYNILIQDMCYGFAIRVKNNPSHMIL